MVSGACFTGLVLYILFALSYYALIKAILSFVETLLSLARVITRQLKRFCLYTPALIKAVLSL